MESNKTSLVPRICKIVKISFIVMVAFFYALLFVGCPPVNNETLTNCNQSEYRILNP